jgi:hypothetical protein
MPDFQQTFGPRLQEVIDLLDSVSRLHDKDELQQMILLASLMDGEQSNGGAREKDIIKIMKWVDAAIGRIGAIGLVLKRAVNIGVRGGKVSIQRCEGGPWMGVEEAIRRSR